MELNTKVDNWNEDFILKGFGELIIVLKKINIPNILNTNHQKTNNAQYPNIQKINPVN
jgi:hypothetical protein